jgi:serine protease
MDQDAETPAAADDDGLNGFVVVALEEGLVDDRIEAGDVDDLIGIARALNLDDVADFLRDVGVTSTGALIPVEQRGSVSELEGRARRNNPDRRTRHSLLSFWRIDATGTGLSPATVAEALSSLAGVHVAYPETRVTETFPFDSGKAPGPVLQGVVAPTYRDPAPDGVDAEAAWARAGGDGSGVRFVDLEQGWREKHPAMPAGLGVLPDATRVNRDGIGSYIGDHGTAVVGIVAGADTGAGLVGLARGLAEVAAASHYDRALDKPLHVAAAISQATVELTRGEVRGGILLVEVERGPETKQLPTETEYADFQAITTAVDNFVVVVEAAGNGGKDLDAWSGTNPKRVLRRGDPDSDSGAIMVGACVAPLTDGGHCRLSTSNWGERVDCHAWGAAVLTATAAGFGLFGGTSAASAIVAGVAAAVQGMQVAAGAPPLGSTDMRTLLSAPDLGTPQVAPGLTKAIGSMPDLRRIAEKVPVQPFRVPAAAAPGSGSRPAHRS